MLRLFFIIILSVVVPVSASYAASGSKEPQQVLRGKFSGERNTKNEKGKISYHTEGTFVVVPGRGAIWNIQKPEPGVLVFTEGGMSIIAYDTLAGRAPADKYSQLSQVANLMADGLVGKWDSFEKFYVVERAGGEDSWSVKLTTRAVDRSKEPFSVITASGGEYTTSVGFVEPNGSYASYKITDQKITEETKDIPEQYLFNMAGIKFK